MKYVSIFSGIEAATVAWEPLGWEPVAFAEIDPFCCDLLAKRYPNVPNLGDVSKIDWSPYVGSVDLVVGGSPCQAFSVAGKRQGLMDSRGRLMLEYVRAVHDLRPRWLLWENVTGVLSQSGSDAFETLLGELEQCGYSLAWRVLDAQFFGVAQRRRRVFVVGHSGTGGGHSAAVLFEREGLRWDSPSSREKRKGLTENAHGGAVTCVQGTMIGRSENAGPGGKGWQEDMSYTLDTNDAHAVVFSVQTGHTGANGSNISEDVAPTLDCATPCAVAYEEGCLNPWDVQSKRVYSEGSASPTLCSAEKRDCLAPLVIEEKCYCMADDYGKGAVDYDLSGTLKVGGSSPFIAYRKDE